MAPLRTITAYPKEILDRKFESGKVFYYVLWKDNSKTWEPAHHIEHRTDLIAEFEELKGATARIVDMNVSGRQENAYALCRISQKAAPNPNYDNGGHTSLESQEREIRQYCTNKAWNLIEVVTEVRTGKEASKLKALSYLLDIARPKSKIVVYDFSRLARDLPGILWILETKMKEKELEVVSVLENVSYSGAAGRFAVWGFLATAAYYSEQLSEKQKRSVARRKSEGHSFGRPRFGFKAVYQNNVRKFVEDKDEQKIINYVKTMSNYSPSAIVENLIKKRVIIRGKNPTVSTIRGIQKRWR